LTSPGPASRACARDIRDDPIPAPITSLPTGGARGRKGVGFPDDASGVEPKDPDYRVEGRSHFASTEEVVLGWGAALCTPATTDDHATEGSASGIGLGCASLKATAPPLLGPGPSASSQIGPSVGSSTGGPSGAWVEDSTPPSPRPRQSQHPRRLSSAASGAGGWPGPGPGPSHPALEQRTAARTLTGTSSYQPPPPVPVNGDCPVGPAHPLAMPFAHAAPDRSAAPPTHPRAPPGGYPSPRRRFQPTVSLPTASPVRCGAGFIDAQGWHGSG
jgi:hypothetical protein